MTNTRIVDHNNDIAAEYRRLEAANGGANREHLVELERAKAEVLDIQQQLQAHDAKFPTLISRRDEAERSYHISKAPLEHKREEVTDCEDRLNSLKRDRGQQRSGFPLTMNALIDVIRQDKGFQQVPIGPIGQSIQLLKPAWSSVLEKTFGGMLNSFLVTCKQDQSRLSGIMQRMRRYLIVYCQQSESTDLVKCLSHYHRK